MKTEIITGLLILVFSISFVLNIVLYHVAKIHKDWSDKFRDMLTKEIAKGNISAEPLVNLLWDSSDSEEI